MTVPPTDSPPDSAPGLRQQAVHGVLWTTLEKWSIRLSTLVGFVILGNLLSPEEFGIVALAMTFITFSVTIADGGFASYLLQMRRLTDAATNTAFVISSAMALVLAAALAAFAVPISRALDVAELRDVLPALALSLLLGGLSTVPAVLLSRQLRFKELAVRQITATVLSVVVAVVLAFAGAGVWALVAQTLVRTVVSFAVLWATSDFRPSLTFDRGEARAMTTFGAKSLSVLVLSSLRVQGEVFIIGVLAGPVALGYWAVAGRLVNVVVDVFASVVSAVARPVFARLQDAPDRLGRALSSTRGMSALVLVPALVLLALVSDEVVPAVFGEQWAPATTVASVLALAAILQSMSGFDRTALLSTGRPGAELVITIIFVAMHLVVAYVFHADLVLLAAATAAVFGLSIPVRLLVVHRLLGVPISTVWGALAVLLAGGVAAAAVVGAQAALELEGWRYVALALSVGSAVYAAVVLVVARSVVREATGTVRGILARRVAPRQPEP